MFNKKKVKLSDLVNIFSNLIKNGFVGDSRSKFVINGKLLKLFIETSKNLQFRYTKEHAINYIKILNLFFLEDSEESYKIELAKALSYCFNKINSDSNNAKLIYDNICVAFDNYKDKNGFKKELNDYMTKCAMIKLENPYFHTSKNEINSSETLLFILEIECDSNLKPLVGPTFLKQQNLGVKYKNIEELAKIFISLYHFTEKENEIISQIQKKKDFEVIKGSDLEKKLNYQVIYLNFIILNLQNRQVSYKKSWDFLFDVAKFILVTKDATKFSLLGLNGKSSIEHHLLNLVIFF